MKKIFGISLFVLILDQLIKQFVQSNMTVFESISVIPNFFSITFVKNEGAAFSILNGNRIFLIGITILSLVMIYKICIKNKTINKLSIFIYSFLIGGILGNLLDRIIYGYVIDYLDFQIFSYDFPIFNLADICIVIGCILLGIDVIREEVWKKS